MEVQVKSLNLESDEFRIECELRQISGSIRNQYQTLDNRFAEEQKNLVESPQQPHGEAVKYPHHELSVCASKLQSLKSNLLDILDSRPDDADELDVCVSRVIHVYGRLRRLQTLPDVNAVSLPYMKICQRLIDLCKHHTANAEEINSSIAGISGIIIEGFSDEQDNKCVLDPKNAEVASDQNKEVTASAQAVETSSTPKHTNLPPPRDISTEQIHLNNVQTFPYSSAYNIPNQGGHMPASFDQFMPYTQFPPTNLNDTRGVNYSGMNFTMVPPRVTVANHPAGTVNPVSMASFYNPFSSSTNQSSTNVTTGKLSNQTPVYKWKIKFDGCPSKIAVENFFLRIEHLARTHNVPLPQLLNDISFLLDGPAQEHYWLIIGQNPTCRWDQLRNSFFHRFQDRRTDVDIRKLINDRKQKQEESFVDFYYDILTLSRPMKVPLSEGELLEILKKNMRVGLIVHLAGRSVSSVADLVSTCISTEDAWKSIGYTPESISRSHSHKVHEFYPANFVPLPEVRVHHSSSFPVREQNTSLWSQILRQNEENVVSPDDPRLPDNSINAIHSARTVNYNPKTPPPVICWNCRVSGHYWMDCNLPPRIFCYTCGKPDVMKPHCPSCTRKSENLTTEMREIRASRFRQDNHGPHNKQATNNKSSLPPGPQ